MRSLPPLPFHPPDTNQDQQHTMLQNLVMIPEPCSHTLYACRVPALLRSTEWQRVQQQRSRSRRPGGDARAWTWPSPIPSEAEDVIVVNIYPPSCPPPPPLPPSSSSLLRNRRSARCSGCRQESLNCDTNKDVIVLMEASVNICQTDRSQGVC